MIEQVITSTVLILAIMLIAAIFEKRINPCIKYALWLLVAVKLLVPLPVFESKASVMNVARMLNEKWKQHSALSDEEILTGPLDLAGLKRLAGFASIADLADLTGLEDPGGLTDLAGLANMEDLAPILPELDGEKGRAAENESAISLVNICRGIWIGGICLWGSIFLWSNLRFGSYLRRTRTFIPVGDFAYDDITSLNRPAVYKAEGISSPCLFGLIRPAIYLNKENVFVGQQMQYVLEHEYTHYRHKDFIWALVRCVCVIVYWFNPFVWLAAYKSICDCELACDAGTLKRIGEMNYARYGKVLIAAARNIPGRNHGLRILGCSTGVTGGMCQMKKRMKMIVDRPRTKMAALLGVVFLCGSIVGCTFGSATMEGQNNSTATSEQKADGMGAGETGASDQRADSMGTGEPDASGQEPGRADGTKTLGHYAFFPQADGVQSPDASDQEPGRADGTKTLGHYAFFPQAERAQSAIYMEYKGVPLYVQPQEDKVCIKVQVPGVRSCLYHFYIPDVEMQDKLAELIDNLEEKWQGITGRLDVKGEAGYWIYYKGKKYMAFESGYLYDIDRGHSGNGALAKAEELCEVIQQMLDEKLDYRKIDIKQLKNFVSAKLDIYCSDENNSEYSQNIKSQTITDPAVLQLFEEWFSNAEPILGGAECGNQYSCLELTMADGEVVKLSMATDSCSNFGVNGVFYDYRPSTESWDNSEFYRYFNEISFRITD